MNEIPRHKARQQILTFGCPLNALVNAIASVDLKPSSLKSKSELGDASSTVRADEPACDCRANNLSVRFPRMGRKTLTPLQLALSVGEHVPGSSAVWNSPSAEETPLHRRKVLRHAK
jgi:hypothetical protein